MEISSDAVSAATSESEVKVAVKARDQEEAVVGTILNGVSESTDRLPEQSGRRINIAA